MTQVSRATFKNNTATLYADNTTGNIGANDLRAQMNDIADSTVFKATAKLAAPTANDDGVNTGGNGAFGIGDVWVDESNNKAYLCVDNSTSSAIWTDITYIDPGALSAIAAPAPQEMAVWVDDTTLRGFPELKWNDGTGTLQLTGNITVSGTVDGRDISADGTKLDGIPSDAINSITTVNENVGGGSIGYPITSLQIATGDGLELSNPSAGVARLEIRNNDITKDLVSRTLGPSDNFSFITNQGASTTVRWTLPITSVLASTPRLVAIFFKSANYTMEIIGANTVTVNGVTESGGNETLITICDTPYETFAYVFYGGASNTYFVVQGSDVNKVGTPANNQLAVWTGNGTVEGDANFTWDGTTANVTGEVKYNWTFVPQVGLTYTLELTDRGRIVTMNNASPNTLTIPDNATVEFPIGTEIRVIQIGAGATSIAGDVGVTLNSVSAGTGAMTAQWGEVRLYKVAADEWYATGDIGAVA